MAFRPLNQANPGIHLRGLDGPEPSPPTHPSQSQTNNPCAKLIPMPSPNKLFYGDNLTVLREYVPSSSVDLVYLDPPFNSRADYNVLFAEKDGTQSTSQITAFEDTWEWNLDAEHAYQHVVEGGGQVADAMRAFRTFLGHSDMVAYLAMMAHASSNSNASSNPPAPSISIAGCPILSAFFAERVGLTNVANLIRAKHEPEGAGAFMPLNKAGHSISNQSTHAGHKNNLR